MGRPPKPSTSQLPLPPPPAPVARNANPWPMPEQLGDSRRQRGASPTRPVPPTAPQPPTAAPIPAKTASARPPAAPQTLPPAPAGSPAPTAARPSAPVRQTAPPARHGLSRYIPLAIFLAILGSVISGAFEAYQRGDRIGALVPLLVVGIIAIGWWRSMQRSRHR